MTCEPGKACPAPNATYYSVCVCVFVRMIGRVCLCVWTNSLIFFPLAPSRGLHLFISSLEYPLTLKVCEKEAFCLRLFPEFNGLE